MYNKSCTSVQIFVHYADLNSVSFVAHVTRRKTNKQKCTSFLHLKVKIMIGIIDTTCITLPLLSHSRR